MKIYSLVKTGDFKYRKHLGYFATLHDARIALHNCAGRVWQEEIVFDDYEPIPDEKTDKFDWVRRINGYNYTITEILVSAAKKQCEITQKSDNTKTVYTRSHNSDETKIAHFVKHPKTDEWVQVE